MRPKVTVRERDRGLKALKELAKTLTNGDAYVKAGVLGGTDKSRRPGEPVDNVDLAMIHEFGAPGAGIPERSFIRSTFEAQKASYVALMRRAVPKLYERKLTVPQVLGIVGAKMASDIKMAVTRGEGIPPPNAPATIQRKGSDRPLIDTGRLIGSVTWAVITKGGQTK